MGPWRLLPRLRGETSGSSLPDSDPFAAPDRAVRADALSLALSEMEAAAREVYALHGLPTRPGHYERGPRARRWRFIAERLTPQERFERALAHPREAGWRFARLEDLGERSNKPDLAAASTLLTLAARLREARQGPLGVDDLLTAMELGATWRANREIILAARPVVADVPKTPQRRKRRRPSADVAASSR